MLGGHPYQANVCWLFMFSLTRSLVRSHNIEVISLFLNARILSWKSHGVESKELCTADLQENRIKLLSFVLDTFIEH